MARMIRYAPRRITLPPLLFQLGGIPSSCNKAQDSRNWLWFNQDLPNQIDFPEHGILWTVLNFKAAS